MIIATLLFALVIGLLFVSIYFLLIRLRRDDHHEQMSRLHQEVLAPHMDKLSNVVESLADGVIVVDASLTPEVINTSAHNFLSLNRYSNSFADIANAFPKEVELEEKIREAISFDRRISLHEVVINYRTFQVFITPLNQNQVSGLTGMDSKTIVGASILMQDLTTEKSTQKMKEEFSHMIVHDLRAPVVAIKDTASLLKGGNLKPEDEKNLLNLIHDQANKLITQISTILDAAKYEDGKLVLRKNPGDLGIVVQEELSLFLPEAKKKNITMIAEIGNDLPIINFDKVRITEALNNIISNSLKYTNDNGVVKITVDTDEIYQRDKMQGHIIITVADNGIGIPEEKQNVLFTKYGEANANANPENQKVSSGLGLYITKGIIESHHGSITIQSKVGHGTTVIVTLPINTQEDKSQEAYPDEHFAHLPN